MTFLKVATLIKTHGLKGDFKIKIFTNLLERRFKKKQQLIILDSQGKILKSLTIEDFSFLKADLGIISFHEINDFETALTFIGQDLMIPKNLSDLKDDEVFYQDLIGLKVFYEENEIGTIIAVDEILNNSHLRVKLLNSKEILIPYQAPFIIKTDLEHQSISVTNLTGFFS
ncbi:MAG: ribosome maturation factor RimM [Erysipelotrichaceae bacterium]|jgi:16S rRNA processing protein RimM|nr:ribosome maturation factor RimM [Erysipelotrichaceae bacterium]